MIIIIIIIIFKSHSVWIDILQTSKNMHAQLLTTLKRIMRDIKANYKYTSHSDVNLSMHVKFRAEPEKVLLDVNIKCNQSLYSILLILFKLWILKSKTHFLCSSNILIVAVVIALVNIYSDIISSTYFDINYLKLKNRKID